MRWVALVPLLLSGASLGVAARRSRRTGWFIWRLARAMLQASARIRSRTATCIGSSTSWTSVSTRCSSTLLAYPARYRAARCGVGVTPSERDRARSWSRSGPGRTIVIGGERVDDFAAALETMLERLRERTDGVIVAANIRPHGAAALSRRSGRRRHAGRIESSTQAIAEQAGTTTCSWSIFTGRAVEDDLVSEGRISPQQRGHRRIADEFLEVLYPRSASSRPCDGPGRATSRVCHAQ